MKNILLAILFLIQTITAVAQEKKLYNPSANAIKDIAAAVKKAKAENKFVLIQAGGNWCSWCIEFARFCKADAKLDSAINASFIWYHLNYSKENKNKEVFAKYGFAQRFGFPVFIILDGKGNRLNTQASEYLEDGKKSYDAEKVLNFLQQWNPKVFDAKLYND